MPISKHFGGNGTKVAASMKKQYGDEWESVFYATDNKKKPKRDDPRADVLKSMQRKKKR